MISTEQTSADPAAMPATSASLIESAAAAFEVDRDASRQFLFRASALLRAGKAVQERRVRSPEIRRPPGRLAPWQINRVIAYIEANLAATLQACDLASAVNLSMSHFFRGFKVSTGMTPFEYVAQRRVELALKLMRTTNDPLSQIAIQCGLCDQSHLCRLFRRLVGQTPDAWRRANATGPRKAHQSNASPSSPAARVPAPPARTESHFSGEDAGEMALVAEATRGGDGREVELRAL
jgi:AraC family transcriptional regulator